ncbi:MAG: hypothetical protein E7470_03295 [Ruminococcaceae bacterium]|nr:hypothetical protein [Oscillospiraceae bacterium]
MKKILALMLSLCLLLCLCACGQDQNPTDPTPSTPVTDPTDPSTKPTDPTIDDGKVTYTVTVTDEQGNPLHSAMLQLCKDACIPAIVDANGTVTWTVPEDDYKVSFLSLPAGFTYSTEETEFYFADGETSMTIVLKAAEE